MSIMESQMSTREKRETLMQLPDSPRRQDMLRMLALRP